MEPELLAQQSFNKNTYKCYQFAQCVSIQKLKCQQGPKFQSSYVYILGQNSNPIKTFESESQLLYRYNLTQSIWERQIISNINKAEIDNLINFCGVLMIQQGELIIFGGSNKKQCQNNLWGLNLQNLNLKKFQQKSQNGHHIPSPRELASMVLYREKYLVLFGGINLNNGQIYNDINILDWESKIWLNCLGNYQYIINSRYASSMCVLNDKFYIFGGQSITSDEKVHFLNDFYEIEIKIKHQSNRQRSTTSTITPVIVVNRIITDNTPKGRGGHFLFPLGQQNLILIGGQSQNRTGYQNLHAIFDVWIYSILTRNWVQLTMNKEINILRSFFATKQNEQQFYIFGGVKDNRNICDGFFKVNINIAQISIKLKSIKSQEPTYCLLCKEIKENKLQWPFKIQDKFIQEIVSFVQPPFFAFGMLIDNAHIQGATLFNISYEEKVSNRINFQQIKAQEGNLIQFSKKQNYFRLQDNGKCFSNQQLQNSLINFQAGIFSNAQGIDKKMKYIIGKQNSKRQFGINLKLGAFKLSHTFLYINILTPEQIRVTLFQRQLITEKKPDQMIDQNEQNTNNYQYVCYYYSYNPENSNMLYGYSSELKKAVEQKYYTYIQEAVNKKNIKNVLYLFDLKQFKQQKTLYADARLNDIIFGYEKSILQLQKAGVNIYEACDVSLKAFISCFYLKNQLMKITLSVCNAQKKEIPTQMFLLKIDKMLKNKQIMDLTQSIENDCKIIELYYNPDLTKKVNCFHNGVLLYHRNRLITRFDHKLGETIKICQRKILNNAKDTFNIFNLFGYIELPDAVPINIYKTDFIYTIMMQKLYSRLKYVMKFTMRKKKIYEMSEPKNNQKRPKYQDQSESDKSKQQNKPIKIQKKLSKVQLSKQISMPISVQQAPHVQNENQKLLIQQQNEQQMLKYKKKLEKMQKQEKLAQPFKKINESCSEIKQPQPLKKVIKKKLESQINQSNLNNFEPVKIDKSQQHKQYLSSNQKKKKEKVVPEPVRKQHNLRVRLQREDFSKSK